MFVPVWLIFLTSGTFMAIGAIVWAIRSDQFEEQDRARYLPLVGLSVQELRERPPIRRGASFFAILAVFASGIATLVLTLALVMKAG